MITRSRIIAGPAYCKFGTTSWRSSGKVSSVPTLETISIKDPLSGTTRAIVKNRYWKSSHVPLYYDPTVTNPVFFPWLSVAATRPGAEIFGADTVFNALGNNGDTIGYTAAAVTKMPDLFLGVEKDFYASPIEFTGVNSTGADFATESNLHTIQTGQSFTAPAVPGTSVLGRQKYTAVWGTYAGFTSFQGFAGFTITHELELHPVTDNGQLIGYLFQSYRAMAKVVASANTMEQMVTAMVLAGTGAAQGQDISAASADLVISGASGVTATIKGAALVSGGFEFGPDTLRQGEIGFVSTNPAGTNAGLVLA